MEDIDSMIDPHNEVRKLQELVKKLERQNEVLRSKQGSVLDGHNKQNVGVELEQVNINNSINSDDLEAEDGLRQGGVALDEFDDVDVSKLMIVEDDDSWLYASPKSLTPQQSSEQLMSWMRKDFDHPSPDVESSRRSLISKLDEAARMKHSSSSPILGGNHPHGSRSAAALSRSAEESTPGLPTRLGLQRKSGLNPPSSNRNIDSGTFTRPKRATNGNPPFHGGGDQPQELPAVPNAEDIENLAKQQEESLRQSIAPSNRKGFRSKQGLVDGDNARLSPSRFDVEGSYMARHRGSLGSDHSTPPDSPQYNQHFQLNNSNDSRSLRAPQPVSNLQHNRSHNSSDSSLERHSVNSDEMNLAPEANRGPNSRLQQPNYRSLASNGPKKGSALPSMSQSPQQARGLSPQRMSGLPTPRRQIMRPSSAPRSSLPMYRRTNIPSPKPTSQEPEENWRDGCF